MRQITIDWLPNRETLVGIHNQICDAFPLDENGDPDFNEEPVEVGKLSIGLLLLTINLYYKW